MRLLLDTQVVILAALDPTLLTRRVRELLIDPEVERWVSVVSLWEIAMKVKIGKLDLPEQPEFYAQQVQELNARILEVSLRHSFALFDLPLLHRDPFDRVLIAQSRVEQLSLVSRDRAFDAYGVSVIW